MSSFRDRRRLQLIGGHQLRPAEGDYSFLASLLDRLPREANGTGDLARYVGYDSYRGGADHVRFFGIEVNEIESIPAGLEAWDLADRTWSVWEPKDGGKALVWQEEITWQWLAPRSDGQGRPVGEFRAHGPSEWNAAEGHGVREFRVFANSYLGLNVIAHHDGIYLADYDPSWPAQFEEMAAWLRSQQTLEPVACCSYRLLTNNHIWISVMATPPIATAMHATP